MKIYNTANNQLIESGKTFYILFPDNIIINFKLINSSKVEYIGCTILNKKLFIKSILNSNFSLLNYGYRSRSDPFNFTPGSVEYIKLSTDPNVTNEFLKSLISRYYNNYQFNFNYLFSQLNSFTTKVTTDMNDNRISFNSYICQDNRNEKIFINKKLTLVNYFIKSSLISKKKKDLKYFSAFEFNSESTYHTFKGKFFNIKYNPVVHANCCGFAYLTINSIVLTKNISNFAIGGNQINQKVVDSYFKELKYDIYNLIISCTYFTGNKSILFVTNRLDYTLRNTKIIGFESLKYKIINNFRSFIGDKKYFEGIVKFILQKNGQKINNNILITTS